MTEQQTFQKIYEQVCATHDFSLLNPFCGKNVWSLMSQQERELLGLALVSQGEKQLIENDHAVTETFALAGKIAPFSAPVWLRQGRVFATQRGNIRCLLLACKALEKAVKIDPDCFSAWFSWAVVLLRVGMFHNDPAAFREAEKKFEEIYQKFSSQGLLDEINCEFYWKWGLSWFYHGKHSGEAMDFRTAIEKFQQAAEKGLNKAVFWNDYGNALVDLGCLIGRQELLYDASQLYHKATEECADYFPAWLNLACCYQELYTISGAEDFFRLAEQSFTVSASLEEEDISLWIKWGGLYTTSGKLHRDERRLAIAAEKFAKADQVEPNHSIVLDRWAQSLALLGGVKEDLSLLKEAEEKILASLALAKDNTHAWHTYAVCLMELGHYFSDEEYFFSAVDKFQYGASQNPGDFRFFYGIAQCYSCLGQMQADPYLIDKALESFAHAFSLHETLETDFWNDWGVAIMRMTELTGSEELLSLAIEKFEHAIAIQGGDKDITFIDPQLLYNYGCALDFLGDFSDNEEHYNRAIQVLQQLIILDPDFEHARYNLGLAWSHLAELTADREGFERAAELFQQAIEMDQEDDMSWNDWGLALLNLSRLLSDPIGIMSSIEYQKEAEGKFLHAVGLGNLSALYNLVCLYSLDGNFDAAMHYLIKGKEMGALPSLDDVMQDEWLEPLRQTEAFRSFILQYSNPSNEP